MNNKWFNKLLPHLAVITVFLLVAVIYCSPVLKGEVLRQHDNQRWKAMAQQSFEFKEKYGHFPLWTNSMFGGMPAYQIALEQDHPVSVGYLYHLLTLGLPKPINFFFLACICFYALMLIMRIKPWIGAMAAMAYAYSTYDPVIIAVGHDTKMLAIAYAPAVIGGLILLFQKQYIGGTMLLAAALTLQMSTMHLQIVYYTMITAAIMSLFFLWQSVKQKQISHAIKSFGIALLAAIISLGATAVSTLTSYEAAQYSIRGADSELKDPANKNTTSGGLDKDYAMRWSYGIGETFTLIHPSVYGGGNGGKQITSSKFAEKLTEIGYPEETAIQYANGSSYWGPQPTTSGPVYVGAVICFLFILGIFMVNSWHKWWILAASLFAIILAWGKNLESVNYFLFDHLPMYKKFRAPTMALVIPQLCFPLLAAMGLQNVLFEKNDTKILLKKIRNTGLVTAAVIAFLLLFYVVSDFNSSADGSLQDNFTQMMLSQASQSGQQPTADIQARATEFGRSFIKAIQDDRRSLFIRDLLRNIFLVGLSFGMIWLFVKNKMNRKYVVAGILLLSSFDLLGIAKRYLNDDEFIDETEYESAFRMSPADAQIKQDTGYYRVYNQMVPPFDESLPSYYHNTIGGYHPAKLSIFQDLYENQLAKGNMQVFNMMNTKYFIIANPQNGQPMAQMNPGAFGPAWFVKGIHFVKDGKEEMKALDSINLKDTAIVQEKFRSLITEMPVPDSAAVISLVENRNDDIIYQSQSATPQFAVFSEIYYPAGWKAFIDGKETKIIKTNYALRGISVPTGRHSITFKFAPRSYKLGNTLVLWSSLIVYLILLAGAYLLWRKKRGKSH